MSHIVANGTGLENEQDTLLVILSESEESKNGISLLTGICNSIGVYHSNSGIKNTTRDRCFTIVQHDKMINKKF
jgi:hypothetical protein